MELRSLIGCLIQGVAEVVKKGEGAKVSLSTPPTLLSTPLKIEIKGVFLRVGKHRQLRDGY
jgi:hypothetical protein